MNQFGWMYRGHIPFCRVQGIAGSGAVRFAGILFCGSTTCSHVTSKYPDPTFSRDDDRYGSAFADRRSTNHYTHRDRHPTSAYSRAEVVFTVGWGNSRGAA